jgi:hypothetical protein
LRPFIYPERQAPRPLINETINPLRDKQLLVAESIPHHAHIYTGFTRNKHVAETENETKAWARCRLVDNRFLSSIVPIPCTITAPFHAGNRYISERWNGQCQPQGSIHAEALSMACRRMFVSPTRFFHAICTLNQLRASFGRPYRVSSLATPCSR